VLATYIAQMLERSYAETAASMRLAARARLARWLLQARSLLDSDQMGFSHDRISRLMGLRRPTVTVELHALEGDHLIRSTRGLVTIRDVDGLRAVASSSSAPDAPLLQIA
jgi:CRP-like cAMP-binding protein